jgi:hypothetical protein
MKGEGRGERARRGGLEVFTAKVSILGRLDISNSLPKPSHVDSLSFYSYGAFFIVV